MRLLALLTLLFAIALPAGAETSRLQSMLTGDDSRGWEAVGRLNMGHTGFCTGTLIAEDLVLTAAHCLYEKDSGRAYAPQEIEFLAGWRGGRAAAYRSARRMVAHPGFTEDGGNRAYDLALIELDLPIRTTSIQPFATGKRRFLSRDVSVVSYAHDRSEMPSIQETCHVLGRARGTLVLDCDVDFGSSGAPVFDLSGEAPRIISVVSALATVGDEEVSLGTSLEEPLEELRVLLQQEGDGVFRRAAPAVRSLTDTQARDATGAKFVRP